MTHKALKRFQIEGLINDDTAIWRTKETVSNVLIADMRDSGYVPALDVGPAWSLKYVDGNYQFLLTIHGVFVGVKQARRIYGIMDSREVMME
jgi:hypothetical protein